MFLKRNNMHKSKARNIEFSNKPEVAVRKLLCQTEEMIYSLTYSKKQVHILKMQLKLNCFIGLVFMVVHAYVATINCKLQRIQCEPCF